MIFRLSQKLNDKLRAGTLASLSLHENHLPDWSAHAFVAPRAQSILVSNTRSLYSTVLLGRDVTDDGGFVERASSSLREFLATEGHEGIYDRHIAPMSGSIRFARALDRSITGSMNELIVLAPRLARYHRYAKSTPVLIRRPEVLPRRPPAVSDPEPSVLCAIWRRLRQLLPRITTGFGALGWLLAIGTGATLILLASSGFAAPEARARPDPDKPMAPLPRTVPAPKDNPTTPEKVALGKLLFFDPRLSGDNETSCATCHRPDKAFGDGLPQAKGAGGKALKRNTPSLLNVGFYATFHWDGRAKTLEEQALLPIQATDEMNQDLDLLEKKLNAVPGYASRFHAVFGTKVTREGIAKSLAAFERTLVTGPSPYDRYLGGEKKALSMGAKRGMDLFFGEAGCAKCHRGPLLTDEKFYRLGVSRDKGRELVTGKAEDRYKIRTPSLRNVARTRPYMHDGSYATLGDVLFFYLRGVPTTGPDRLPLDIDSLQDVSLSQMTDLIAFLEALTGEEPRIVPPKLP